MQYQSRSPNMFTLPSHFTFEVTEQDWDQARRAGLNYIPVRCPVWQAMVRSFPALNLDSDPELFVTQAYLHFKDEVWMWDQNGRDLITRFDYNEYQHLPCVIEATIYSIWRVSS